MKIICQKCNEKKSGVMTCRDTRNDKTTNLCQDCIIDSGFCMGCGFYSSGIGSFDFSPMKGFCAECVEEIKSMGHHG